jgi:hypothetical protein
MLLKKLAMISLQKSNFYSYKQYTSRWLCIYRIHLEISEETFLYSLQKGTDNILIFPFQNEIQ